MADSKEYGVSGIGPDVELGVEGPRILVNAGNVEVRTNDGASLVKILGAAGSGPDDFVTFTQLGTKQDTLISGTNIKTVNGNSLLGSGNLVVGGSGTVTSVGLAGTANQINVAGTSPITTSGSFTLTISDNPILPGTSGFTPTSGTTAQRPASPTDGQSRFNLTEEIYEGYVSPYGTAASPTLLQRTLTYRKRIAVVDDFIRGSLANNGAGIYGDLGWSITNASTPSNSLLTLTDHPGVLQMQTANFANAAVRLHLGATQTTAVIMSDQIEVLQFLIYIPTNITSIRVCAGGGTDQSSQTFGTDGIRFQFDPSVSGAMRFITRSGGVESFQALSTVAANTWYLLEAYYNGTSWTPVMNGTAFTAVSTNIPSVAINIGISVFRLAAPAKTVQIDYFSMISRELGVRY